jgi:hypothetical protein
MLSLVAASNPTDTRTWVTPTPTASWPTPTDDWFAAPATPTKSGLSGAAIAGIALAGILVLVLIGGFLWVCCKKRVVKHPFPNDAALMPK